MSGLYEEAGNYILPEAENKKLLSKNEQHYQALNPEIKKRLKTSEIQIDAVEETSDTLCVIHYQSEMEKEKVTISLKRVDNKWLVDLRTIQ